VLELLAPLFAAAGIAAAAVPVWLHRFRRTPAQRMPFSIVRFLRPSLPAQTRRVKIEHWPLMLLRILALCLIGLAFARPFHNTGSSRSAVDATYQRTVLLVDCSASMRRDGIRDVVQQQMRDVVAALGERDQLCILRYSRSTSSLLSFDQWQGSSPELRQTLLDSAIAGCEPDWMETRTGYALLSASDEAARDDSQPASAVQRRIVLITDFQRGSQLDEIRSRPWPPNVQVDLKIVQPTITGNAGLSVLPAAEDDLLRVRVTASADAQTADLRIQPFDRAGNPVGNPLAATTPAGQRRTIVIPLSETDSAAGTSSDKSDTTQSDPSDKTVPENTEAPEENRTETVVAGAELLGDSHPFDNVVDLPVEATPALQLALLGATDVNDADSMRYYLQRVVDGDESRPWEIFDLIQSDGIVQQIPDQTKMVVVMDVVPETLLDSLQSCLLRQATVLIAVKSPAVLESVSRLLPEPLQCAEAEVADYAMFGRIDFSSPLFSSFSEPQFSDFTSIRFRHYRRLTTVEKSSVYQTVASFDSGDPVILQTTLASGGRIILFAAGWHPADSQWAMSSRFPPMMMNLLRRMIVSPDNVQLLYTVGDEINPAALLGSGSWVMELPDGTTQDQATAINIDQKGAVGESSGKQTGLRLVQPGRYLLWTGSAAQAAAIDSAASINFVAGLAAEESWTEPLPRGQLQSLGVISDAAMAVTAQDVHPSDSAALAGTEMMTGEELENAQMLWQWMLLTGLILLLAECVLAGSIARRRLSEEHT
jgi:hypothetical protein